MNIKTYSRVNDYFDEEYYCECCQEPHSPDNDTPAYLNRIDQISGKIYSNDKFDQYFMSHGLIHREDDKPAAIYYDGYQEWYCQDKIHRELGPATVFIKKDGNVWRSYWIHDQHLTREEFIQRYEFIFMKKYEGL